MKILIIGGGGREHALAWRLAQDPEAHELLALPGNPGIAQVATCKPWSGDVSEAAALAEEAQIDLTVVGPEAPLVAGIVDRFRDRRLKIIGPTQSAARLEGSKIFAKRLFERAGIPTARSVQVETAEEACSRLKHFSFPLVIKADGLAAGKGVIIANDRPEALSAIEKLGPYLVLEEFLAGEEISFIGLSDGNTLLPFAPSQDHKKLLNGDQGPNTGGMGAYCGGDLLTASEKGRVMENIMLPALTRMKGEGTPFTGFLYAGLMMTADGPKVLEFNARLGDPETQALMLGFQGSLADVLSASARGPNPDEDLSRSTSSACVVLSARGYPERPSTGDRIEGIEAAEGLGAKVFHAGTRQTAEGLVTAGGRVLGVTATAEELSAAVRTAYSGVAQIHFEGMHYRTDIGSKAGRRRLELNQTS